MPPPYVAKFSSGRNFLTIFRSEVWHLRTYLFWQFLCPKVQPRTTLVGGSRSHGFIKHSHNYDLTKQIPKTAIITKHRLYSLPILTCIFDFKVSQVQDTHNNQKKMPINSAFSALIFVCVCFTGSAIVGTLIMNAERASPLLLASSLALSNAQGGCDSTTLSARQPRHVRLLWRGRNSRWPSETMF